MGGIGYLRANSIFVVRISSNPANPANQQSRNSRSRDQQLQQQQQKQGEQQLPQALSESPLRVPRIKGSAAGKRHPPQESKTIIVNGCVHPEAVPYPTPGLKTKTYAHNVVGFVKTPRFSLEHREGQKAEGWVDGGD